MVQKVLNLGNNANDGTGDDLRSAMTKVDANFTELFTDVNLLTANFQAGSQLTIIGNEISSNASNANIVLDPNGTGNVIACGVQIHDNEISSYRTNDNLLIQTNGTATLELIGGDDIWMTASDDIKISPNDNVILAPLSGSGDIFAFLLNGTKMIWEGDTAGAWEIMHTGAGVNGYLQTGTAVLPVINENLWTMNVNGHSTTANISTFGKSGTLEFYAGENWTTTAFGSEFKITTTVAGAVVPADRFKIDINGNTTITGNTAITGTLTTTQLDVNHVRIKDHSITTNASNANLDISAHGTGYVSLSGLKYPSADGTTGQLLRTDGAGNLSWVTVAPLTFTESAASDGTTTIASSTVTNVDTFAHVTYRSGKYIVQIVDVANTKYEIHEILVVHDGTTAFFTDTMVKSTGGSTLATFTTDISGSDCRLRAVGGTADSLVYKFHRNLIEA